MKISMNVVVETEPTASTKAPRKQGKKVAKRASIIATVLLTLTGGAGGIVFTLNPAVTLTTTPQPMITISLSGE